MFVFSNPASREAFGYTREEFLKIESRRSAEEGEREGREELLRRVRERGYVDDYEGVRVRSDGVRFEIRDALVWNLVGEAGVYCGQAAAFDVKKIRMRM